MLSKNIIYVHFKQVPLFISHCRYFRFRLKRFEPGVNNVTGNGKPFMGRINKNFNALTKKNVLRYLKRKRSDFSGCYSFVVDDGVAGNEFLFAEKIAEEVMEAVRKMDNATVIEINPGMGKITKHLMEKGLKQLNIFEPLQCILCKEVIEQFREKIKFINVNNNTFTFHKLELAFPIDVTLSKDETAIIIAVNTSRRFLRRVIERVILIDHAYLKNHEYYLLLSEDIYHSFEDLRSKYAGLHDYVCFDLVFKTGVLAKLPRSAILPPALTENKKMYFLRLQGQGLKFTNINLVTYWNFLSILTMKKYKPVLAVLEKWFPGSGLFLIAKGFSVFTEIHELTREDFLILYAILKNCENFESTIKMIENEDFISLN